MKRYSPYTFTQYLQKRRLLQAAHMLTETKEPVENIMVAVGYENSSHFHRLFKDTYGMTPKEYRRSIPCQSGLCLRSERKTLRDELPLRGSFSLNPIGSADGRKSPSSSEGYPDGPAYAFDCGDIDAADGCLDFLFHRNQWENSASHIRVMTLGLP